MCYFDGHIRDLGPLITHPDVEFWEEDDAYHLRRGHAYEVNNKVLHGGCNPSPIDRVHLIFDYYEGADSGS